MTINIFFYFMELIRSGLKLGLNIEAIGYKLFENFKKMIFEAMRPVLFSHFRCFFFRPKKKDKFLKKY